MRPLITISEEKMEFARYIADGNGPESVFRQVVAELDAQRAETPREPVDDRPYTPEQLEAFRADFAQWEAERVEQLAAVRRQAIEDAIALVNAATFAPHVEGGGGWLKGPRELRAELEALRDHPTRSTGERGEGDRET